MRLTALLVVTALPLAATSAPADTVSQAGDVAAILIPAAAAAGSLVEKDHQGLRELALAYGSTLAVVYALKATVDRTRPNGHSQSFPSGHTASAFAGAAFVQRRYGWRVGVPAYLAASFVGYSRVESNNHHTSDVLAGAAIGIAANLLFTHPLHHTTIALDGGPRRAGILVAVTW
jgi:membrane-associated phospholipid phosphatase